MSYLIVKVSKQKIPTYLAWHDWLPARNNHRLNTWLCLPRGQRCPNSSDVNWHSIVNIINGLTTNSFRVHCGTLLFDEEWLLHRQISRFHSRFHSHQHSLPFEQSNLHIVQCSPQTIFSSACFNMAIASTRPWVNESRTDGGSSRDQPTTGTTTTWTGSIQLASGVF